MIILYFILSFEIEEEKCTKDLFQKCEISIQDDLVFYQNKKARQELRSLIYSRLDVKH